MIYVTSLLDNSTISLSLLFVLLIVIVSIQLEIFFALGTGSDFQLKSRCKAFILLGFNSELARESLSQDCRLVAEAQSFLDRNSLCDPDILDSFVSLSLLRAGIICVHQTQ